MGNVEEYRTRKSLRLKSWDYGDAGYYFVTICTRDRELLLCRIVGADVLIGPHVELSRYGRMVDRALSQMSTVDRYVIMPNHIHVIFRIPTPKDGPMGTSAPTLPSLVRFLKRTVTVECGSNIWQRSYYDHIIRDYDDYLRICEYIDANPSRWAEDPELHYLLDFTDQPTPQGGKDQ